MQVPFEVRGLEIRGLEVRAKIKYYLYMNSKLTIWAFWLSLISIIMSGVVIALWLFKAKTIAIIQLDTFIGVIVALMALLVTIVLGWQIYNAVEIKEKLISIKSLQDEQRQLKNEIEQARKAIQKANIYNAFYHSTMMGLGARTSKDDLSAFRFLINALKLSLQADEPMELNATMLNLLGSAKAIKQDEKLSKIRYDEIIESDKAIRKSKWFYLCQEDYDDAYSIFLSKIFVIK